MHSKNANAIHKSLVANQRNGLGILIILSRCILTEPINSSSNILQSAALSPARQFYTWITDTSSIVSGDNPIII